MMIWITDLITKLNALIDELKEKGIYINSELSKSSDATFNFVIDANADDTFPSINGLILTNML